MFIIVEGILTAIFAYLLGAVPFSLILPKVFCGVDVRKVGSQNVGATNVYRACGIKIAIACFLLDGLKGLLAVVVAQNLLHFYHAQLYIFGFAAILGHVYPVFLKFKGGKGVATSIFIVLALDPLYALLFAMVWLLVFAAKKVSSISAFAGFAVLVIASLFDVSFAGKVFYISLLCFILFTHRKNIKRLIYGAELKL